MNLLLFVSLNDISQKVKVHDHICTTSTPAKEQLTITNVTDRNKQESFAKLMDIAYELALKPNLPLTAFNFVIKALRRCHVNIIKGN